MRIKRLCLFAGKVLADLARPLSKCHTTTFPSLLDADLEDLTAGLQSGSFTSVDLVKAYSARIEEVNSTLHVVTEINPEAAEIAAELDAMRADGALMGPLHGIPILIKNNMGTSDQMRTTAGSWALWDARVPRDSTVVAKLRNAGAIILGKVNLSQWANFRSQNSSNGWSAHGGQTYGAWTPGQDPHGSSSGSGVASDLGLAWAALGTETAGSILYPSESNNLVGIKPTVGLTSRYMVIPISEHQDTVGPMTRTVMDAAHVLQAIAGIDVMDNYTSAIPNHGQIPDYVAACDRDALAGTRIGVVSNVMDILAEYLDQPVIDAFNQALRHIEDAGATIVYDANFTGFDQYIRESAASTAVLRADFRTNLPQFLSKITNPRELNDLGDIRRFTHECPLEAWPRRDTNVWDTAMNQTWNNTDAPFWKLYEKNLFYGGEGGVLGALKRTNTSAILLPTQLSMFIPALVGSPVITVPMGSYPPDWKVTLNQFGDLVATAPNVPFGLGFMGAKFSEAELIGLAYSYEQRTLHRHNIQHYIVPNIELEDIVGRSLSGGYNLNKTCPKEWIEKCEAVSRTPRVWREKGAPLEQGWWTKILKGRIKQAH